MTSLFGKYRKFVIAGVGAAIIILTAAFGGTSQWVNIVVAVATALGVYGVPNSQ